MNIHTYIHTYTASTITRGGVLRAYIPYAEERVHARDLANKGKPKVYRSESYVRRFKPQDEVCMYVCMHVCMEHA